MFSMNYISMHCYTVFKSDTTFGLKEQIDILGNKLI